jgi:hypothetical protein
MNHALMNMLLGLSGPWLDEVLPSKPDQMIAIFLGELRVGVGPIADFRQRLTTGAPELLPSFEQAIAEVSKYPGTYLVYASSGPDHHFAIYGEGKDKVAQYVDPEAPTDALNTLTAPAPFSAAGFVEPVALESTTDPDAYEPETLEDEADDAIEADEEDADDFDDDTEEDEDDFDDEEEDDFDDEDDFDRDSRPDLEEDGPQDPTR